MKSQILVLSLFALFVCISPAYAQQGVIAAGGEATGTGGTMSFSTGQTDFMYFSSETGSIQFGLQQVLFFDDVEGVPKQRFLTNENLFQGEDQCFDAFETIILAGGGDTFIVEDGTGVELIAGQNILMLPGTMVEYGGYMHARITSNTGPFCDVPEPIVASLHVDIPENRSYQEPLFIPGNEKSEKAFFWVYPNPTKGDFTVEMLDHDMIGKAISIEILSMRGEIVFRFNDINRFQHELSLHGYQPGLYMVRVQSGDNIGIERIIKR